MSLIDRDIAGFGTWLADVVHEPDCEPELKGYECSQCHKISPREEAECPHCGAIMDVRDFEEDAFEYFNIDHPSDYVYDDEYFGLEDEDRNFNFANL